MLEAKIRDHVPWNRVADPEGERALWLGKCRSHGGLSVVWNNRRRLAERETTSPLWARRSEKLTQSRKSDSFRSDGATCTRLYGRELARSHTAFRYPSGLLLVAEKVKEEK